jgi:hypothetical protein
MNNEKLAEELRGKHVEDSLWDASCRLEQLRKRCESEVLQDEIFGFEQRLDILLGDIKEYALWLGEEEL